MNKKSVGFTQSIRHSLPGNNNERENKLDYFSRSRCRSNRFNKKINLIFFFQKIQNSKKFARLKNFTEFPLTFEADDDQGVQTFQKVQTQPAHRSQ